MHNGPRNIRKALQCQWQRQRHTKFARSIEPQVHTIPRRYEPSLCRLLRMLCSTVSLHVAPALRRQEVAGQAQRRYLAAWPASSQISCRCKSGQMTKCRQGFSCRCPLHCNTAAGVGVDIEQAMEMHGGCMEGVWRIVAMCRCVVITRRRSSVWCDGGLFPSRHSRIVAPNPAISRALPVAR